MSETLENTERGSDCHERLVRRLIAVRSQMDAHQRGREQGKLLMDCCDFMAGLTLSLAELESWHALGASIEETGKGWDLVSAKGKILKNRATFAELVCDMPATNDK